MTNTTVQVPVGNSATMISSGLPAGSTIFNTDTADAVWVSSSPSLTVGAGIQLTALGSATWSGGPVYAICNTGVTSPVLVNLSTDANNYQNPVAIGTAVSQQLLNNGVPNVLTGSLISGVTVNAPFPVGGYGSVSFSINITAPSGGYVAITSWADSLATLAIKTDYVQAVYNWSHYFITVPVYGPYMSIQVGNASIAINAVYASNRVIPNVVSTTSTDFHWDVVNNTSYPVGFTYPGGVFATQGGPSTWYLRCASTFKGAFGYQYWDLQGANPPGQMTTMQFAATPQMQTDDGGNLSIVVQQNLPRGILQPFFYNQTSGSYGQMRIIGVVS